MNDEDERFLRQKQIYIINVEDYDFKENLLGGGLG